IDTDLSADLDVPRVLNQLVDHALALFGAQHAAILRPTDAGGFQIEVARRISAAARRVFESEPTLPLTAQALAEQRVISETDYARDRRAGHFREWLLEEGINTVTVVPLVSGGVSMAGLALYHDIAYEWDPAELALLQRMGRRAADALRNAELFRQTSRWAAQLHSIQQLGVRLNRLNTVGEIGRAIASELDQLISCDNVRVYRLVGDDCLPVAWRGRVGEYEEEDGDQLRCKVGEGVTGWVALHGLAQNVADAANDERSVTIPGTDDGLPESLLLAPMLFEDAVIGIIVLAKLGLRQFSADDLRLLEIYASIAAQAMVNADSTEQLRAQSEQLEQQLTNQRELLRVTESILGTLETDALLDEISHRIGSVLHADNVVIDRYDEGAGLIRPLVAHGINAADFMARTLTDREGVGAVVVRTGQALLVRDMLADPRIIHFDRQEPHPGALIVVPLRARDRVTGLLSIERLGETASFSQDELELVQLFAAHVSIALNNARVHRAVELRAETDALTGLWNQGALDQHLQRTVEDGAPFGLLMVDLDNFKDYNDRFGHQAGNLILRRLGQAIRSACRHSDLVFRYGGDEFAVLLPNTPARRVPTVAGKVSEAVRSLEHDGGGEPAGLSCSIGWAALPADAADAAGIVLAADRACYAAKRQGRDRIADAAEGLASAPEFKSPAPTPVDEAGAYSLA
ncbi:MAG TPA: GAF domain-containing protein, partial [Candidatus Limnocylindria bacterium]|nr:GAF domain-containing protein [Candidatus Limnocylindria bacterium]